MTVITWVALPTWTGTGKLGAAGAGAAASPPEPAPVPLAEPLVFWAAGDAAADAVAEAEADADADGLADAEVEALGEAVAEDPVEPGCGGCEASATSEEAAEGLASPPQADVTARAPRTAVAARICRDKNCTVVPN
ncbi:hypothetical protein [Streptomyces acidicola]|uniref:hypothetical protein n=1 Tax=Streptomyces acidicola TaxID=2596892 RepID=UPI00341AC169